MKLFDTIAAVSTPVGVGGIAIVRVSGEDAIDIAQKIIKTKSGKRLCDISNYRLVLSFVHKPGNESDCIDEALVSVMRAPGSYTGETVVEINCHGGYLSARMILEELVNAGARIAEAGEFSRRAFVNGKMDLTRAEAVADVIHSHSELGHKNAANTMMGTLGEKIKEIRSEVIALNAHLSAVADFPDEIEEINRDEFVSNVRGIQNSIKCLIDGAKTGKLLRDGICTVIIGKPNVGKSSLLNAFAHEDRAIVTDIEGTTRDVIEEYVNLKGIALKLLDTAGIREGENQVERLGIERSVANIAKADLVLFVVDLSREITEEDIKIARMVEGRNMILVLNKSDRILPNSLPRGSMSNSDFPVNSILKKLGLSGCDNVMTSVLPDSESIGIEELENKIFDKFMLGNIKNEDVYISNERHKEALIRANECMDRLIDSINKGLPYDLLSVDLDDTAACLGEITGLTIQEEVIDEVFAKFCVGK